MTPQTAQMPEKKPAEGSDPSAVTPRMDQADLKAAGRLSLQHLRPPARVAGYEQEEFLGRGAFGEVWKAIDSNSGRAVAIKFYSRRGGLDWSHMTREVEKLQHLFSDRYVVQLFGVGWDSDPPYYVMEYMPYGSLEDRLRQGPIAVADAVLMVQETARGLVHAHDKGILHCDLKPSNIMLDQDDRPRLADFGQARLKHDRAPSLGTLFYMAPEQADLTATPDARWDVYALGTILYRMVTGKLPYLTDEAAASVSTQSSIDERLRLYRETLHNAPPPTLHRHVPGVDRALETIIDRCLAVDPKQRYRNVQSVLTALEMRQAGRSRRSLLLLGVLGPALVFLVMAIFAALTFRRTLATAENQLVARTLESDRFAATTVAAHFTAGLDKRLRMLEEDATDAQVRTWLADAPSNGPPTEPKTSGRPCETCANRLRYYATKCGMLPPPNRMNRSSTTTAATLTVRRAPVAATAEVRRRSKQAPLSPRSPLRATGRPRRDIGVAVPNGNRTMPIHPYGTAGLITTRRFTSIRTTITCITTACRFLRTASS